ncbi:S-adenosyl-L-methionine-dependent methyltransferase [Lasiosphaeria hispida]|uniref:S-adenosyl-L-methionine-dependent methyltransferase n=1 Tax=Lasiosphaeria hispida TaxID=260671 RepID=A0AAJ0MDT0_9PEZI|nr:S-adenosyl-L-methionine-dependent methyltransferase [Lasiosphaeria hispida]
MRLKNNIQSVLDVGAGTGLWAIDFADKYPSALVTGIDLSPIQPDWVPSNCEFEIDDALLEWTFSDESYVDITAALGAVPDWTWLYKQAYHHLKPGGWIEHTEISFTITSDDGSIPPESAYLWWNQFFCDAGEKMGMTFEPTRDDFGFTKFADVRDSEKCICCFYYLNYKVSFVCKSFSARLKAKGNESSTNLYLSNLPKSITEVELHSIYMVSGILRDSMGNSHGVGFA